MKSKSNKSIGGMKEASGMLSDASYTMRNRVALLDCSAADEILQHIESAEKLLERAIHGGDE